jgi:hypothetical protein
MNNILFTMKNFFKTKSFFWLLIPVFFLLRNINIYFGFIRADQVLLLLAEYLLGSAALYLVVYRLAGKSSYKTSLYCLLFLSVYFFFHPLDEFVERQTWLMPLNRYRYFLPFLLLCLLAAILYIRKITDQQRRATLFLNLLLSIFCLIELSRLFSNLVAPPKPILGLSDNLPVSDAPPLRVSHPNVYFLLFDEYQGNAGLQRNFQFDNAGLIQALKRDSFYIPKLSRTNYNYTFFSMPSIFNMSYVKGEIQGRDDPEILLKMLSGIKLIQNARVMEFFKRNNYTIVNLSPFPLDGSGSEISRYGSVPWGKLLITRQTFIPILVDKFAWEIDNKTWLDLTNPLDYWNQYYNQYVENRLIDESASASGAGPRFTYAHFFMPHSPFLKDSAGNEVSLKYQMQPLPRGTGEALYFGYLKYSGLAWLRMVGKIIKNDPQSIIIVMSDHGARIDGMMQYNNQFSIRIPGADYSHWPDTVDAVNVFRILLNDRFGQKLDYLPYRQVPFTLTPSSEHK